MNKYSESGFSAVEALLILVILAILGFTGYFVYHSKQTADKNLSTSSTQQSTTKTATDKTEAAKSGKLYVSEWQTSLGYTVKDNAVLQYTFAAKSDGHPESISLTTDALANASGSCKNASAGTIVRGQANDVAYFAATDRTFAQELADPSGANKAGKLGSYYYVYISPDGNCSTDGNSADSKLFDTATGEAASIFN